MMGDFQINPKWEYQQEPQEQQPESEVQAQKPQKPEREPGEPAEVQKINQVQEAEQQKEKQTDLKRMQILVSKKQYKIIREAAFVAEMSMSEFVRALVHYGFKVVKNSRNPRLAEVAKKYFET